MWWLTIIVIAVGPTFATSLPIDDSSMEVRIDDAYPQITPCYSETGHVEYQICPQHSKHLCVKICHVETDRSCSTDMIGTFKIDWNRSLTILCSPKSLLEKRIPNEPFKEFYIQCIQINSSSRLRGWKFKPPINPAMSDTPDILTSSTSSIPVIETVDWMTDIPNTSSIPASTPASGMTPKDERKNHVYVYVCVAIGLVIIIIIIILYLKGVTTMNNRPHLVDLKKTSNTEAFHKSGSNAGPSGVYEESSGRATSESSG